ncbi:hypothetical protein [Flavimaricola marinus]|uniref:Gluconate 2-dehydrogenase subunit 3 n=1 Tax=Flavimaricola marinus TaxID=1819565 RepID=A0A238LF07_9RHOB|nr:hypothetical protein [Flavimaricola marinus]SMY08172.1 hypothetical protein LOM8899_02321 [Flavimaricola marinus]
MSAMLDTMIPGDADFPAASAIGLHDALTTHDRFAAPYAAITALLPDGFDALSAKDKEAALTDLERQSPAEFNALTVGAYSLYYTHPQVAAVIEALTGHTARPPQPAGHPLEPFDPAMVAVPAARGPLYRPTPEAKDV